MRNERPKIFSNSRLGSTIPQQPSLTRVDTDNTDRTYRMLQPGSFWLNIRPVTTFVPEVLAIEVRIQRPSPLPDLILGQYRYIQRRRFNPKRHAYTNTTIPGNPVGHLYATAANVPGSVEVDHTQTTMPPYRPYRQSNSFGPFWIHSYIQPDPTAVLYHIVGGASFDLPAIGPAATPTYYAPESSRIGDEPRQSFNVFFTLGKDHECRIRVRGFNHSVAEIPGFSDAIPSNCEPAADEIPASWVPDGLNSEAPIMTFLPITL